MIWSCGRAAETIGCGVMLPDFARRLGGGTVRGFVPAALLAALVLVGVLGVKNSRLEREVRRERVQEKFPHPGMVVPAFRAATLAGDSVTIGTTVPGGRQVLFYFNSSCPYCLQSLQAWKTIATRLRAPGSSEVGVFGISLDSVSATVRYVAAHGLDFPVLRFPNGKTAAMYRAIGVPITVVLNDDGDVLYGRAGALIGSAVDSVMAAVREGKPDSLIVATRRGS